MDPLLYDVPEELFSPRLRLRIPRAGDGVLVHPSVQASIQELHQWMPWAKLDYSAADAELWCRKSFVEFHARRELQFLMLEGDHHIGSLGAFAFDWDARSCEIGYWLRTDRVGNALMTEAVLAVCDLVVRELKVHRIRIRCDPRNVRSANVARRCGFELDGTMRHDSKDLSGHYRDTHVFSRLFDSA
jgi:RimJ/RimL family protein N-acetyltransferase